MTFTFNNITFHVGEVTTDMNDRVIIDMVHCKRYDLANSTDRQVKNKIKGFQSRISKLIESIQDNKILSKSNSNRTYIRHYNILHYRMSDTQLCIETDEIPFKVDTPERVSRHPYFRLQL